MVHGSGPIPPQPGHSFSLLHPRSLPAQKLRRPSFSAFRGTRPAPPSALVPLSPPDPLPRPTFPRRRAKPVARLLRAHRRSSPTHQAASRDGGGDSAGGPRTWRSGSVESARCSRRGFQQHQGDRAWRSLARSLQRLFFPGSLRFSFAKPSPGCECRARREAACLSAAAWLWVLPVQRAIASGASQGPRWRAAGILDPCWAPGSSLSAWPIKRGQFAIIFSCAVNGSPPGAQPRRLPLQASLGALRWPASKCKHIGSGLCSCSATHAYLGLGVSCIEICETSFRVKGARRANFSHRISKRPGKSVTSLSQASCCC